MHCSRNPERLARNEHTTQKQIQNIYAHARLLGHGLEVQLAPSAHAKWWIHTDPYYDNRWQVSQVLDAQAVSNARHGSYPLPCAPNLDAEVVPSSRDYPSPLIPQGVLSPGLLVQLSGGSGERPSSARLLTQSCRVMFRKSGLSYTSHSLRLNGVVSRMVTVGNGPVGQRKTTRVVGLSCYG